MIQFIHDIHECCRAASRPAVSFEFFPPKTPEGERNLLEKTIPSLLPLKPDYCSVTYGAGGTTRDKNHRHRGPHSARARADDDDAFDMREFDQG
jgi:5,10-methylenetetrahydrofolate reductase